MMQALAVAGDIWAFKAKPDHISRSLLLVPVIDKIQPRAEESGELSGDSVLPEYVQKGSGPLRECEAWNEPWKLPVKDYWWGHRAEQC